MSRMIFVPLVVSLMVSVGPALARAVACPPTVCPTSDLFEVTDAAGKPLTDSHGNVASIRITEGASNGEGIGGYDFDFAGLTIGVPVRDVLFVESSPSQGVISDGVELRNITGVGLRVSFFSDGDPPNGSFTNCFQGPDLQCIAETGSLQDLTPLFFPIGGAPFHIFAQSDPAEVPEPGTLLLLGSGLAGLAAMVARRQRV